MALNPLVSLFGRLVARSGRKRGNRQTDGRTTDGRTVRTYGCHLNFGPGKNGPRTKIFNENFGPPGPVFPKILVHIENFGPGTARRALCGRVYSRPVASGDRSSGITCI